MHQRLNKPHNGHRTGTRWSTLLFTIGTGSALGYLLDPQLGRQRRARARDQALRAVHMTGREAGRIEHDLANRAHGLMARLRSLVAPDEASDEVVGERIRAAMGRSCSNASAIEVSVANGEATLTGPILEHEHAQLVHTVGRVRGVSSVNDRLERHLGPNNIPRLQHGKAPSEPNASRCSALMKREVQTVSPDDSVRTASDKMTLAGVGFLPVCDSDRRVVGTLTDRDIVVRVVAKGLSPESTGVGGVMTHEVVACRHDDEALLAEQLMAQYQVSRIVITDDEGILAGVISLSDIAERESARRAARTLRAVASREAPRD